MQRKSDIKSSKLNLRLKLFRKAGAANEFGAGITEIALGVWALNLLIGFGARMIIFQGI